ncbi:MAG: tRNA uridine-5-carboxymethylaminomethyl(34) synthesis enzyme MnmG [Bacteroidales bacterium]|jgi:tRNA uridine 5-carboxymethylaminomethyl modification enzyme|nr:tRNA uridine-5-carboxymethylaminomethyl(34) synthesis enzyme MnmG [Bacteroidales bacterium]
MNFSQYDIIVVGAGHAGCEAAAAAANMGASVLLITFDMEKIAQMSCNPAMGGIAKGQIVREIDALGGQSAIVTDKTSIQFRMLNRSKGPAMWSPRAQSDRMKFSSVWRSILENTPNLDIFQDGVDTLIIDDNVVKGVITRLGIRFYAKSIILTNGTFLNGLMHVGRVQNEGGRVAEQSSKGLSDQLLEIGFEVGRMKTGTPARIDARSINFEKLQPQFGDPVGQFSFLPNVENHLSKRPCYIAYTNPKAHRLLERGFKDSPLYNGTIQSIGPRYCPSIEDKIVTFASKDSHHLFLEPEGETTNEFYINGFSSSLPWDIQWEALRQIEGLEQVKIFRPGYAIEYDFFPPTQLSHTLETKRLKNLYFAGQINGTTGYEEAAAQGLMAGINAVLKIRNQTPFILNRDQAYIGVLIDDLVTKGVDEPYRMFTSRAEYRILLRQDDADVRLTPLSHELGLASEERMKLLNKKATQRDRIISFIKTCSITPESINLFLQENNTSPIQQKMKLIDLLVRPQVSLFSLKDQMVELDELYRLIPDRKDEIFESAEILVKYSGYIEREKENALKLSRLENIQIPNGFDFRKMNSLSTEARMKLSKIKPLTIGQAARIPGVSPADINVLLVYFGR